MHACSVRSPAPLKNEVYCYDLNAATRGPASVIPVGTDTAVAQGNVLHLQGTQAALQQHCSTTRLKHWATTTTGTAATPYASNMAKPQCLTLTAAAVGDTQQHTRCRQTQRGASDTCRPSTKAPHQAERRRV